MGDGSTKPAGDLGKNIYNTDGTFTGNRSVDLAAYYLYFYNSTNTAKIGINKINPTEALDIVGRMRADAVILNAINTTAIPNRLRSDGTNVYFSSSTSVERRLMYADYADLNTVTSALNDTQRLQIRSNLKLSTENYSSSVPRIDFIAPFKLGKDIVGTQYLSCIGSNLLLNLSDCEVKLINTTTNVEYPVNVINTSANTTSQFSFGYNIASLPVGAYRVYVRNMLLTNLADTTTFEVVNTVVKKDLSTLNWQKAVFDGTFTNSIASGNSVYRQPQTTSGETLGSSQLSVRKLAFLSGVFLNNTEANGNWQIDFSVQYSSPFYANYSGGSRFGIVDGTVVTSPTVGATIAYGQITDSSSGYWRMFPSNIADTATAQTNGKYSIVKKGSIVSMFQIIAGTRIKLETHIITANFGNLRFIFGANGNASNSYDMAITVNIDSVNV